MRHVLVHSPNLYEEADAIFWHEDGKLRYVVAEERPEFMRALAFLEEANPDVEWEVVIDFLVHMWPNLIGVWDDFQVEEGHEQAVLDSIR